MIDMPRELAMRLLFDDCDRIMAEVDYKNAMRVAGMLEWLRKVYCKGLPELRVADINRWALECAEIYGVDVVWLSRINKNAGITAQK